MKTALVSIATITYMSSASTHANTTAETIHFWQEDEAPRSLNLSYQWILSEYCNIIHRLIMRQTNYIEYQVHMQLMV